MSITQSEFDLVRKLAFDEAGIVLEHDKQYLVESRLQSLAKQTSHESPSSLIGQIARDIRLKQKVVEAMTTNETTFFRDHEPFEMLKNDILPALIQARQHTKQLRFWYAACSTGQEPYSMLMLLAEHFPQLASWNVTHLATDISKDVIAKAREGEYTQFEVNRGLPALYLAKYFQKKGLHWKVSDALRRQLQFQEFNLNRTWVGIPKADIVFLRNVMIYFDLDAKRRIFQQLERTMEPDGYLFLGTAETTLNVTASFQRVAFGRTACYRPAAA
ncbi:MAG: protein-glutamate O-methyltransferase CheR [Vicinamibacterales bacterium]